MTNSNNLNSITKKSLLELKNRECLVKSTYDSLIIFNSGLKHESGFGIMYIAGLIDCKPVELIKSGCDSISWESNGFEWTTDLLYPSGLLHFFGVYCKFEVGFSLSSTQIKLIKTEKSYLEMD